METKLVAMLEPLAGVGNVRAVVKQTYNQSSEERNDEVYDPALVAPLSIQKSEQSTNNAARASGVPGTASNTPAAAVPGAVQGSAVAAAPGTPPLLQPKEASKDGLPVYPQTGGAAQSTKQESATYGVSKHTSHSESGPGRLERVSAAVVINDRQTSEGNWEGCKAGLASANDRGDASAGDAGSGGGWLRRKARRPGDPAERKLQYEHARSKGKRAG